MFEIKGYMVVKVVLLAIVFILDSECQDGRQEQRFRRTQNRRTSGGLPSNLVEAYNNALTGSTDESESSNVGSGGNPVPWEFLAPTRPSVDEIECHVEVITTELRGGRCTQLAYTGGYICQSGVHFDFAPSCQNIINQRQSRPNQRQSGPNQRQDRPNQRQSGLN